MNRQIQNQNKTNVGTPKKAYQKPELSSYGTINEITNAVGNMGGPDGGNPPNKNVSA